MLCRSHGQYDHITKIRCGAITHPVTWYPIKSCVLNAISCVRVKEKKKYLPYTWCLYFLREFCKESIQRLWILCEYQSKRSSNS